MYASSKAAVVSTVRRARRYVERDGRQQPRARWRWPRRRAWRRRVDQMRHVMALLEAAGALIRERGVDGLSLREAARRVARRAIARSGRLPRRSPPIREEGSAAPGSAASPADTDPRVLACWSLVHGFARLAIDGVFGGGIVAAQAAADVSLPFVLACARVERHTTRACVARQSSASEQRVRAARRVRRRRRSAAARSSGAGERARRRTPPPTAGWH